MKPLTHLLVLLSEVLRHPQLQEGGRGAMKLLVSEVYPKTEELATDHVWTRVGPGGKTPVVVLARPEGCVREVAYFTQDTPEVGHRHPDGVEVYEVIQGFVRIMAVGADGQGLLYGLGPGDSLHVFPGTIHYVMSRGCVFLARVTTDHPLQGSQKEVVDVTDLLANAHRHSSAA